ncbi:unnamed protein product [Brassica oleracea var. botrytis]
MSPMSTTVTSYDGTRKLGFVSRLQGMCKVLSFLNSVMMICWRRQSRDRS